MKTRLAALLACAASLAVVALAWGTAQGEGHVVAGCDATKTGSLGVVNRQDRCSRRTIRLSWNHTGASGGLGIDPAGRAGDMGATDREGEPKEIGDGASGPADEQNENGEAEYGADGNKRAIGATGLSSAKKASTGDNGAPGAPGDTAHARAPPAVLSTPRTGPRA